jgi:hypothetical protein
MVNNSKGFGISSRIQNILQPAQIRSYGIQILVGTDNQILKTRIENPNHHILSCTNLRNT